MPSIGVEGFDVFVLGDGDGLEHGLGEIGESRGNFGFYIAAGDGAEGPRQGDAEIASGEQFCGEEAGNVFTGLLGGEGFGFFLGVEVTEMEVAGAARHAALAAVGEGESAQIGGTVFLWFERRTDSLLCGRRTDFILCGRNTANGAIRGHGILLKS